MTFILKYMVSSPGRWSRRLWWMRRPAWKIGDERGGRVLEGFCVDEETLSCFGHYSLGPNPVTVLWSTSCQTICGGPGGRGRRGRPSHVGEKAVSCTQLRESQKAFSCGRSVSNAHHRLKNVRADRSDRKRWLGIQTTRQRQRKRPG